MIENVHFQSLLRDCCHNWHSDASAHVTYKSDVGDAQRQVMLFLYV